MSTGLTDSQPHTAPVAGFPVDVYASFERYSGGVLHVVQGLLYLVQALIAHQVRIVGDWSLLIFLPIYLGYFPVRRFLWSRLYRPYGHVEREAELETWRLQTWLAPILFTSLVLVLYPASRAVGTPWWHVSFGALIALPWALWVPVVLWGRLPSDAGHYIPQAILMENVCRSTSGIWLWVWPTVAAMATAQVVIGLTQHLRFHRAIATYRRTASATDPRRSGPPPPDRALPRTGGPREPGQ